MTDYARIDRRPDIEEILKVYRGSEYSGQRDSIANLCRYALWLEGQIERFGLTHKL